MALDVTPVTWLGPGYSVGTGTITFGTLDHVTPANRTFPALSDAGDADETAPATGDIRKLLFGIVDGLYAKWLLRVAAAAADPAGDPLPAKMTMYKSTSTNDTTGEVTRVYTLSFKTTVTGGEVAAEA